jgi:hypothetical protein
MSTNAAPLIHQARRTFRNRVMLLAALLCVSSAHGQEDAAQKARVALSYIDYDGDITIRNGRIGLMLGRRSSPIPSWAQPTLVLSTSGAKKINAIDCCSPTISPRQLWWLRTVTAQWMRNVIASKTRIGCSVRRDILGGSSSCNLPNASNNAAPFDCSPAALPTNERMG